MVNKKTDKAVLLAAGFGTRLRPLTLTIPKPLLPLDGTVLIDHQLRYLASSGIKEVAVNLHYLGEKIKKHIGDGSSFNLKIHYSEEPKILGTGGGIKKASLPFGKETFVALNSDTLIDVDIKKLIEHHQKSGAVATMVLKEPAVGDNYNTITIDDKGFITEFGHGKYFYTGLQIIGPEMIEMLPSANTESCLINDGYMKLIQSGKRVGSYIHKGYFNDLGTFDRYEKAKEDVKAGRFNLQYT